MHFLPELKNCYYREHFPNKAITLQLQRRHLDIYIRSTEPRRHSLFLDTADLRCVSGHHYLSADQCSVKQRNNVRVFDDGCNLPVIWADAKRAALGGALMRSRNTHRIRW